MTFDKLNLDNLNQAGFDAIQFSLMGMAIVFAGLVIIAIYIVVLPKLLQLFATLGKKKTSPKDETLPEETNNNETEILLAIATAAHLHINFPEGNERITWKSHGDMESPWQVSGRMHSLGVRKRRNSWNRK
ncbi:MAG: hypothetical protein COB71_13205 [Thiotrichales bacterium]|nr:MAG: hypothetical protein COB71_13205 [Thiotrichales bacterium]